MIPTLVLAVSFLAATVTANSEIIWLQPQQAAVVKVVTPGYALWVMDKNNPESPALYRDEDESYWQTSDPGAVLLNISMSPNKHTLFINGQAIMPLEDSNRPPRISANQVHADTSMQTVRTSAASGLLRGELDQEELQHRSFLELDYDRLIEADPETGPYRAHQPTLRFRIMGIGAYTKDTILDLQDQEVLHITLNDTNGGISLDAKRSYAITQIELKSVAESYGGVHRGPEEDVERECTSKSWACPDTGLYTPVAPYYRFIWRKKFDQYGRIGSTRHMVMGKVYEIEERVGLDMLKQYAILFAAGLIALASWGAYTRLNSEDSARTAAVKSLKKKAEGIKYADDAEDDEWIAEHSKDVGTELTDKEVQQLNYIIPEE